MSEDKEREMGAESRPHPRGTREGAELVTLMEALSGPGELFNVLPLLADDGARLGRE